MTPQKEFGQWDGSPSIFEVTMDSSFKHLMKLFSVGATTIEKCAPRHFACQDRASNGCPES
jgi:hypothetical protein